MKIKFLLIFFLVLSQISGQDNFSEISSMPGSFSRMGFGARGIGMGNAMAAVKTGNLASYYNPALASFQNGNAFQTSYSFLSLDRSLNFLSFTRKFEFGKSKTDESKPRSTAGVSIGLINAGVSGIDGRDNQGIQTGELSTSENLVFLNLSNRFSEKVAIGIGVKYYYYKLYEDVTTTGLGFDIGLIYLFNENLTIGLGIADINSKYKWDTTDLYGQEGKNTEERFPLLRRLAFSYFLPEQNLLFSFEFENSNAGSNYLRFGGEGEIYSGLYLRGGVDKLDLSNLDFPVQPSLGFSYLYKLNNLLIGIDYAFVLEPYSSSDKHIVGLNINF